MAIEFSCERCGRLVKAPDSAGGRRGRCPKCDHVMYIPLPEDQREEIPLAPDEPVDEEVRQEWRHEDSGLLGQLALEGELPMGDEDDPESMIVAFVQALAAGDTDQANESRQQLAELGSVALEELDRLMGEPIPPMALAELPPPVLMGYLKQLRSQL